MNKLFKSVVLASVLVVSQAQADMFNASINVVHDGQTTSHHFTFSSMQVALNSFSDDFLRQNFSNYDKNDMAYGTLSLRGLTATFRYDGASLIKSSNDLLQHFTLDIPEAGVNHTFSGTNRNEIDQQVEQWFKDSGDEVVTKIYQAMVSKTPYDPIAGNPTSLMSDMINQAYSMGDTFNVRTAGSLNLFRIDTVYQNATEHKNTITSYSLPISYAHVFSGGDYTLLIDAPIHVFQYDNSQSYSAELGLGLKKKMTSYWSLTPEVYAGGVGSQDMGSLSMVYSGFLKSHIEYPYGHFVFNLSNLAGYMRTQDIKIGDIDIKYKIANWALDNGVGVGYNFDNYQVTTSFDHTTLLGSKWYYGNYDTVKLSLARLKKTPHVTYANLALNASYTFASPGYNSYAVGLDYQF